MSLSRRHKELTVRKPMEETTKEQLYNAEDQAENYFKSFKEVYSMVEQKRQKQKTVTNAGRRSSTLKPEKGMTAPGIPVVPVLTEMHKELSVIADKGDDIPN